MGVHVSLLSPDSFEEFRRNLAAIVSVAQEIGVPERLIRRQAAAVGDYLAGHVEPATPEQRLLKELWECGSEAERQALASLLVKWVQRAAPAQ